MAVVVVAGGLAARAAAAVAPQVRAAARDLATATARNAPPSKTWLSAADEKVRHSHRDADGQEIPGNLRYQLPTYQYVRGSHGVYVNTGHNDLAREPRDPDLPIAQRINCRCASVEVPDGVARTVRASDPRVEGQRTVADVTVTFPRVAESEHPDTGDTGGGWARRALLDVAAQYRARR